MVWKSQGKRRLKGISLVLGVSKIPKRTVFLRKTFHPILSEVIHFWNRLGWIEKTVFVNKNIVVQAFGGGSKCFVGHQRVRMAELQSVENASFW